MVRTGIPGYSGDLSGGSSDDGGSSSGSSSTTTPTSGTDRSGESTFDSGPDPADEFGQELGGDPAESGGRNTSSGGSSRDTTRETTRLDRLAQRYTSRVAEPAGDALADATPAAQIEQATLGTNRLEGTFESAGETIAQAGNLPGIAAGARDAARAFDAASSRGYQPVSIGGVPTGVRIPDPEGRQEVGKDVARGTAATGASAALSAVNNPFEAAGTGIGVAALGIGGSRIVSSRSGRVARGAPDADGDSVADRFNAQSSDIDDIDDGVDAPTPGDGNSVLFGDLRGGLANRRRSIRNTVSNVESTFGDARDRLTGGSVEAAEAVPTGRSQVGTGGRGSVLDPDDIGRTTGRSDAGTSTRARQPGAGTSADDGLPLQGEIQNAGGVRRFLDEQRQAADDFLSADRGQAQLGRQRSPGSVDDTGRTQPSAGGGSFEDIRQDSLTQTQDALRGQAGRPNPGDFERAPNPFGSGGRGDVIDFDSGQVELARTSGIGQGAPTASSSSGSSGFADAAGLGTIAAVNDPTGIAPTGGPDVGAEDLIRGADSGGASTFGALDGVNDQTGIGTGIGTTPGGDSDTESDTGIGSGSDTTPTSDTGGDTAQGMATDVFADTLVDTAQDRTAASAGATGQTTQTLGEPTTAAPPTTTGPAPGATTAAPPATTRPPLSDEEPGEGDDEPAPALFGADADLIGSGIASVDDVTDGLGSGTFDALR